MSRASYTAAVDRLAVPRTMLLNYVEEAAAALALRREQLGARIKQARDEKRWKQKNLAAAVHVEPTTVSRWETGRHEPDLDMLELIAEVLGKPIGYFIDDLAGEPAPDPGTLERVEKRLEEIRGLLEKLVERLDPPADAEAEARPG